MGQRLVPIKLIMWCLFDVQPNSPAVSCVGFVDLELKREARTGGLRELGPVACVEDLRSGGSNLSKGETGREELGVIVVTRQTWDWQRARSEEGDRLTRESEKRNVRSQGPRVDAGLRGQSGQLRA